MKMIRSGPGKKSSMTSCIICTNEAFCKLSMRDKEALALTARNLIGGMVSTLGSSRKSFQPPRRRGVCIVERCARSIEAPCNGCQEPSCLRCSIAAELRRAEECINGERDEELAELGIDDKDLEELVDKIVENLCEDHAAFGAVLAGQWYRGRSFLAPATSAAVLESPLERRGVKVPTPEAE